MRVFVTGATGVIGPATVRGLVAAGHDVRAVARTDEKAALVKQLGAEAVAVDLFDPDAVRAAVAGSEGVLHLATNVPPTSQAARKSAWATHNALRTTATDHLVRAARDTDARAFVKESVTFVYPDRGADWIDEDVPPDESIGMLQPTLEGERIALGFAGDGRSAAVLRFALFYGPNTRHTDEALRMARRRLSTVAGKRNSYMSSPRRRRGVGCGRRARRADRDLQRVRRRAADSARVPRCVLGRVRAREAHDRPELADAARGRESVASAHRVAALPQHPLP